MKPEITGRIVLLLSWIKATCRGVGLSSWRSFWWAFLHIEPSGHFFPHNFLREQLDEVLPFPRFRHRKHPRCSLTNFHRYLVSWQEIVNIDRHNDSLYKRNTTFAFLTSSVVQSFGDTAYLSAFKFLDRAVGANEMHRRAGWCAGLLSCSAWT